jgi:hypothetical protein
MAGVLVMSGVGLHVVAGVGVGAGTGGGLAVRLWSSIVARGAVVRVSLVVMSFV